MESIATNQEQARELQELRQRVQALEAGARQAEQRWRRSQALQRAVEQLLDRSAGPQQLLEACAAAMVEHLDSVGVAIYTLNQQRQLLELRARAGLVGPDQQQAIQLPILARPAGQSQLAEHQLLGQGNYPLSVAAQVVGLIRLYASREQLVEADAILPGVAALLAQALARLGALLGDPPAADTRTPAQLNASLLPQASSAAEKLVQGLRSREAELQLALQTAHTGIWSWDLQSGTISITETVEPLFGMQPGTFCGTFADFLMLVHSEDRASVLDAVNQAVTQHTDYKLDYRIVRRDGSVRWVEGVGQIIRDASASPMRMLGIVRDISERKWAEEALRKSEAGLAEAQQLVHLGSWEWDVASNQVSWSAELYRIYGIDPASFRASYEGFLQYIHPEDRNLVHESVQRACRTHGPLSLTHRIVRPDGSVRWLHGRGQVVLDERDRLVRMVGTAQDITQHRQAEQALRTSEERLRTIFEFAPVGIAINNPQGRLIQTNRVLQEMLGYGEEELQCIDLLALTHPADLQNSRQLLQEMLAGQRDHYEVEKRHYHKGGSLLWARVIVSAIRDSGGDLLYTISIVENSTERKLAEAVLQQAKEEAEQANRAKSEFLSRMSHELRTPLNAILGFAQLLELEELATEQAESVAHISRAGRHLLALINEVLDIARIETGHLALVLEPVAVEEVLQQACGLVRRLASEHQIQITISQLPAHAAYVKTDRLRLTQVLLNLLVNAVKYNRPGGRVQISCQQEAAQLRIAVQDSGRGIPAAQQDRLFRPFERLEASQSEVEGMGLGLALCKALIEAMGGSIGVQSAVGQGSTFWITLPGTAVPGTPQPDQQDAPSQPEAPRAHCQILYIEDNPSNFTLVEHILARQPQLRLLPALQGGQGLSIARQQRPALVLLDLHLPDISGEEVLRQLRADARTQAIPVVVLSADATPHTVERLLASGAQAYLTKPLDVKEFLQVISTALGQAGASPA